MYSYCPLPEPPAVVTLKHTKSPLFLERKTVCLSLDHKKKSERRKNVPFCNFNDMPHLTVSQSICSQAGFFLGSALVCNGSYQCLGGEITVVLEMLLGPLQQSHCSCFHIRVK